MVTLLATAILATQRREGIALQAIPIREKERHVLGHLSSRFFRNLQPQIFFRVNFHRLMYWLLNILVSFSLQFSVHFLTSKLPGALSSGVEQHCPAPCPTERQTEALWAYRERLPPWRQHQPNANETDSLIGIQRKSEHRAILWSGVGEGTREALEVHPWLKTDMQTCRWAAPFTEQGTKTCTGMQLIYLPHHVECSIHSGSRLMG